MLITLECFNENVSTVHSYQQIVILSLCIRPIKEKFDEMVKNMKTAIAMISYNRRIVRPRNETLFFPVNLQKFIILFSDKDISLVNPSLCIVFHYFHLKLLKFLNNRKKNKCYIKSNIQRK